MRDNSLIIGLKGLALEKQEIDYLNNPAVAGVILFKRNYESVRQLKELTDSINDIRSMIIAADQEGGPVQRFKVGFTELPSLASIGEFYDKGPRLSKQMAFDVGQTMAEELLACGVNLSFAPVVDVQNPNSDVLKGRCFHSDPNVVIELAACMIDGMKDQGLEAVIKHFPGHGSVSGDTHLNNVVDHRSFDDIQNHDLKVFRNLLENGVQNVMAAWVQYPEVDDNPACYSEFWLKDVLRKQLGFTGKVFSDDMGMAAAQSDRAIDRALDSGCDYVLLCNSTSSLSAILKQ